MSKSIQSMSFSHLNNLIKSNFYQLFELTKKLQSSKDKIFLFDAVGQTQGFKTYPKSFYIWFSEKLKINAVHQKINFCFTRLIIENC